MKDKFLNRASIRKFNRYEMNNEELSNFKKIVNSSPTSINGNCFSCIMVTNDELKQKISSIGRFQKHVSDCSLFIIFLLDLSSVYRAFEISEEKINEKIIKEIIMTSIIDAAISCTMTQDYAISEGFGTCWIGAIRHQPRIIKETFKLNDDTFPLFGLAIGKTSEKIIPKPKLDKTFINQYNRDELINKMDVYDIDIDKYYKEKYPDFPSRGFYGQIRGYYKDQSKITLEYEYDSLEKMFDIETYLTHLYKKKK